MKAELGIIDGRPYIRIHPDSIGERDMLAHLQAWLPIRREPTESDWYITGDRLPGMGRSVEAQDATSKAV